MFSYGWRRKKTDENRVLDLDLDSFWGGGPDGQETNGLQFDFNGMQFVSVPFSVLGTRLGISNYLLIWDGCSQLNRRGWLFFCIWTSLDERHWYKKRADQKKISSKTQFLTLKKGKRNLSTCELASRIFLVISNAYYIQNPSPYHSVNCQIAPPKRNKWVLKLEKSSFFCRSPKPLNIPHIPTAPFATLIPTDIHIRSSKFIDYRRIDCFT